MAEIRRKWIAAFREQDGFQLMTLLREEPSLLRIKYCECNVLHLAVRKRWYGLVLEVLKKFVHLYKDPSFINKASPRSEVADPKQNNKNLESSSPADSDAETGNSHSDDASACCCCIKTFRDLLTAKEGCGEPSASTSASTDDANWKYASDLDVFAMAVIQGHEGIKKILAEAVANVDGLFDCHPYQTVIRRHPPTSPSSIVLEISADLNPYERERKILGEIIGECFTKTSREQPEVSSSISATDSEATPGSGSSPNLIDKIDPVWRRRCEVTSPLLPVEEFFFLTCFQANHNSEPVCRQVLDSCVEKQRLNDISFMKYLLSIGDTWGTAIHHAMDLGVGSDSVSRVLDIAAAAGYDANVRDGAGRTALHIALALGKDTIVESILEHIQTEGKAPRAEKTPLYDALSGGCYKRFRSLLKGYPREPRKTRTSRVTCQLANCLWEIDEKTVSKVNGYLPLEISDWDRRCFDFIIFSPHLSEFKRKFVTGLLQAYNVELNLSGMSPSIDDQAWLMTPLQWAAYVGDAATLQMLGNDDRAYDQARFNNLSEDPSSSHQRYLSAVHAAARAGHPHAIRTILATGKFDPHVKNEDGDTALHSATRFRAWPDSPHFPHCLANFCEIPDQRIGTRYKAYLSAEELQRTASRRQDCINSLLQAGIEIWQTNNDREIPDPGPEALSEYSTWWYEKLSKETDDAKTSLKHAANAISVTAALVTTVSFLAPLQPPLGYAPRSQGLTATVQVDKQPVRAFFIWATIAFYLALGAITLSLTTSLPMRRLSTLEELKFIRKTVPLASTFLLYSIVSIVVAFGWASRAVLPTDSSYISVNTAFWGGPCFMLVLFFHIFFVFLRPVLYRKELVRRLCRKYLFG